MPNPFFIVGPTAIGKSSLAVEVAARCGAEIVGADAFQVYAGFDLLTGKPTPAERARVRHHLIGAVPPTERYDVARYANDAASCLQAAGARGQCAIVVGGTGLYVKALTHGLAPLPPADLALRAELELASAPALWTRLRALDPVTAKSIDARNKRRLVRAIEVCLLTGEPFSSHRALWSQPPAGGVAPGVFLVRARDELNARIEERTADMFRRGVVEEVRAAADLPLSATAAGMIGWREIRDLLAGRQTPAQCRANMVISTRQYAKRQVTWFQREKHFERVDLSALSAEEARELLCARVMAAMSQAPREASALGG